MLALREEAKGEGCVENGVIMGDRGGGIEREADGGSVEAVYF